MKTRVAVTKEYTIKITAFPGTHALLIEFIKRFFHTEHKAIFGEPEISAKSI